MTNYEESILKWLALNGLTKEFFRFISRSDAFKRLAVGVGGWEWEDDLRRESEVRGLVCKEAPVGAVWDIVVNELRTQTKASCDTNRFDLRRRHERRYEADAFDVLALKVMAPESRAYYFIPSSDLEDSKKPGMMRASLPIKDLAKYRNNWAVFERVRPLALDSHPWYGEHSCFVSEQQDFLYATMGNIGSMRAA